MVVGFKVPRGQYSYCQFYELYTGEKAPTEDSDDWATIDRITDQVINGLGEQQITLFRDGENRDTPDIIGRRFPVGDGANVELNLIDILEEIQDLGRELNLEGEPVIWAREVYS